MARKRQTGDRKPKAEGQDGWHLLSPGGASPDKAAAGPADDSDDWMDGASSSAILREAMRLLDPDEHQAVYLHLICDLRHKDVAALMGIPAGSAGRVYSEAIRKLRSSQALRSLL